MGRINSYSSSNIAGLSNDDYLVLDGDTNGTRKIKASDIISLINGKADEATSLGFVYAVPDATQSLPDNTVHVKDATDPNVIYLYKEAGVVKGLIIAATDNAHTQSQYYFAPDGNFRYRKREIGGTWPSRFSALLDEMVFYKIAKDSPTDITNPDREVLLANATDPNTLYKYKNLGLILPAVSSTTQTQYYFAEDGILRYRTRKKNGTIWPDWPEGGFKEVINQDIFVTDFLDDTLSATGKAADSAAVGEALSKKADEATSLGFVYAVPDATQSLPDNTVHVKDATDPNVIYLYKEAGVVKSLIIAATDNYAHTQSQYYFAPDGKFRYRQREIGGTWPSFGFSSLLDKMVFYKIAKVSSITNPDREVLLADATDPNTLYRYESQGLILPAVSSTTQTQYYFAQDGILRYRTRKKNGTIWPDWPEGGFKEVINQDILGINLNPYISPQNKLDKYFVRTCIDKSKVKLDKYSCILGFGDSIMATSDGGSWLDILKTKVGYSTHYNYAVGNAHFSNNSYGGARLITRLNAFFTDVDNQTIDASTINLIIVACGTNDAKNGTPINTFKTDVNAFFTSLKDGFTNRSIECPPVLVITPIRRGTEAEINKVSDDNLEIKVAKYGAILNNLALQAGFSVLNGFDIPVLVDDMNVNVGSNTATIASFMYEDDLHVHPNSTTGRTTYAQAVITAIGHDEITDFLDDTMSVSGKAADAKAVGDALYWNKSKTDNTSAGFTFWKKTGFTDANPASPSDMPINSYTYAKGSTLAGFTRLTESDYALYFWVFCVAYGTNNTNYPTRAYFVFDRAGTKFYVGRSGDSGATVAWRDRSYFALDNTLSETGKAADAKVTGDAIYREGNTSLIKPHIANVGSIRYLSKTDLQNAGVNNVHGMIDGSFVCMGTSDMETFLGNEKPVTLPASLYWVIKKVKVLPTMNMFILYDWFGRNVYIGHKLDNQSAIVWGDNIGSQR